MLGTKVMTVRKKRLEQLLEIAQRYKGCSRKQLAATVGRDPTRLVPKTGIPKLDLVVELAGVLDWPVGEVATFLWDDRKARPVGEDGDTGADLETLLAQAGEAHAGGNYEHMLELGRRALAVAATSDQRARAFNRQLGALDGLGRYTEVLQIGKLALQESSVSPQIRRMLQSNLANAYYSLWSLVESGAIAQSLLSFYEANSPQTPVDRKTHAFAHYVSGHTLRRLMSVEPQQIQVLAASAATALAKAREVYDRLATELDMPSLAGIARTCRGGLVEAEVAMGRRTAANGLAELAAGLDRVHDVTDELVGDQLESCGWWCIFACNIALRHLDDERLLQRHMAVFTNKAEEIAERLNNWSMRERIFTMQFARWERAVSATGIDIPCMVDNDDVRVIAGAMGRFPSFRETGWSILRSARIVDDR
ncbi:MAG: hypothetical protein V3S08_07250 [Phycisphaerales bacterium]